MPSGSARPGLVLLTAALDRQSATQYQDASGNVDLVFLCVCASVPGELMHGRQRDGWHLGVIVIESATPRTIRCQGDTHLHPFRRLSRGSI